MTSAAESPSELTLLRELVATLQKENALLRQKIDALARRVFGSSSEKLAPGQLELILQLAAAEEPITPVPVAPAPVDAAAPRPRTERAPRLPENLPVIEEVLEPVEVTAAPQDSTF